jgi:hypothetical protein
MASETASQLTPPLREEEIVELMQEEKPKYSLFKLSFLDSISFNLFGYTKLGFLSRGSHDKIDVYLFKCKMHGVQIGTPSGWSNRLVCSACLNEANDELNSRISLSSGLDNNSSITELKKYLTKNSSKNK